MFTEAIEKILSDLCTPAQVRSVESGDGAQALWSALEDGGFLELLTPEAADGAGLALSALFPIFLAFGRHALPLPAAQSIAARALLRDCAQRVPAGRLTLAGSAHWQADGVLCVPRVAYGMLADFALVNLDGELLLLDCSQARRQPIGVHASQCATLHWPQDAVGAALGNNGEEVRRFSAAIHAATIAGAMERALDMTLEYCNDRVQFGKAIGKFQAVQHQLSVMAEQVAASRIAAELAFAGDLAVPALIPAAIAKARSSMAVPSVTATAHALFGAIGVTEELDLQLFTRRLHEWRLSEGSETYWNGIVGQAALARPNVCASEFVRLVTPPQLTQGAHA
ncbi:alkylation response protein AidB-like acyl-CoA dehydrogenase [Pseudomonas sp. 3296]|uniref:acyl-CoA dehydrogenase family protein n=1 Tax=Pseudomonas sp. 3296 TaxID=2817753 RepID=UPI0028664156|nr:acyl-CoA dehydrogenase family protein [Pseudomonas sp. 3296]MDR6917127.1 alkylation response protein AidB-like acyl-CoA dehydrogenase [Pseudomonas sp. 3296]